MAKPSVQRGPSLLAIAACAGAIFVGLAAYLRSQEEGLRGAMNAAPAPGKPPPQVAGVQQAVSAMQLVTVVLDTHVTVTARDESWRGDVDANIKVPVRLLYGTDFSRARVDSVKLGPLASAYLVRVPEPSRIATEVFPEREESQVQTGWLRFRAVGGEYTLGLARRSVAEEARRMVLRPEDQEMVRERTRARVVELVKAVAGQGASVTVTFVSLEELPAVPGAESRADGAQAE